MVPMHGPRIKVECNYHKCTDPKIVDKIERKWNKTAEDYQIEDVRKAFEKFKLDLALIHEKKESKGDNDYDDEDEDEDDDDDDD